MNEIWMVRAGRNSVRSDEFLEDGFIAIGLSQSIGKEALGDDRDQLIERTKVAHPDWTASKVASQAGQVFRFNQEIQVGDVVITYDSDSRIYFVGDVVSEARFDAQDDETPFHRQVSWKQQIWRDVISVTTRNSLGAIQTLFRLNSDASAELLSLAKPIGTKIEPGKVTATTADVADEIEKLFSDVVTKAPDLIEDLLVGLGPYEFQDLIAGILEAMGYRCRVAPKGPDRGLDIFASPDGLGLEEPRIFVEVKHRGSRVGAPDIRRFMGGRQAGDRCLYVSSGGFTQEARYEAERSNVPLTLLALPRVRELLLENYESLAPEVKRLVPLVRVYWPDPGE